MSCKMGRFRVESRDISGRVLKQRNSTFGILFSRIIGYLVNQLLPFMTFLGFLKCLSDFFRGEKSWRPFGESKGHLEEAGIDF